MAAHGTLAEVRSLAAGVLGHEAAPAFEQRLSENASEAGLRAFVKFLSDMNLWSEAEDSKVMPTELMVMLSSSSTAAG